MWHSFGRGPLASWGIRCEIWQQQSIVFCSCLSGGFNNHYVLKLSMEHQPVMIVVDVLSDKWQRSWRSLASRNAWVPRTSLQCVTSHRWSRRCRSIRRSWIVTRLICTWRRTAWSDIKDVWINSARWNRWDCLRKYLMYCEHTSVYSIL